MMNGIAALFLLGMALGASVSGQGSYLSQEYIDTTIQRAFFNLNTATSAAGHRFGQKETIEEARRTVERLKRAAQGDANEKYILWKVSELEYQLFLEENDLLHSEFRQKQNLLNTLVMQFNAEIAKAHPDFARLQTLSDQMGEIEGSKGDETDWLVRNRARGVSRNIIAITENALNAGDFDRARRELDYCLANRRYLEVPASVYGRLEARLRSQIDVNDVLSYLSGDATSVQQLLDANELAPLPAMVAGMNRRLATIRDALPPREYEQIAQRHAQFLARHSHKEDSLVNLVFQAAQRQGDDAGKQMLATLLPSHGVCREKIAGVDQFFLDKALARSREQSAKPVAGISDLAPAPLPGGGDEDTEFARLKERARVRAQARIDSVKAVMEERARVALREWERQNRRWVRQEERLLADLEKVHADARKSLEVIERAYRLEEQELHRRFANRPERGNERIMELRRSFATTRGRTASRYRSRLLELETAWDQNRARQTPRPDLSLYPDLAARLGGGGSNRLRIRELFDFSFLDEGGIPSPTLIALTDASARYAALSPQEKAQLCVEDIYRLLEEDRIDLALATFNRERRMLERYVYHEAFGVLKNTVEQAHYFASDRVW